MAIWKFRHRHLGIGTNIGIGIGIVKVLFLSDEFFWEKIIIIKITFMSNTRQHFFFCLVIIA